jgi:hypothetical protein
LTLLFLALSHEARKIAESERRLKEELREIAECGVRNAEWGKKIKKEEARRIPEI